MKTLISFLMVAGVLGSPSVFADDPLAAKVDDLSRRVSNLEQRSCRGGSVTIVTRSCRCVVDANSSIQRLILTLLLSDGEYKEKELGNYNWTDYTKSPEQKCKEAKAEIAACI